ncbi:MAG TPA: heme o synthase [Candidatus Saccharimonadales bacterium]|nr:heme o synthase [Candidatus Saccharimonadales bacterium]
MRDSLRAYYRLAKPGIVYGNLLTAAAGFVVASPVRQLDLLLLLETLAGIALVIASACIVNNYIDRDIDKVMARTKDRATVTGAVAPHKALIGAVVIGLLGFIILAVHTNWLTVLVGVVGFVDYVGLYTFSKRHTWHATLIGSVSGSTPVVAGYTAVTGRLDGAALILFLILTFWQMAHFYAIALRRLGDYRAAGIPVLPAVHGERAAKRQIIAYMIAFLAAVLALSLFGYAGNFYLIVMGVLSLGWVVAALRNWGMPDTKKWATKVFLYSLILLPALLVITLIDWLLAAPK